MAGTNLQDDQGNPILLGGGGIGSSSGTYAMVDPNTGNINIYSGLGPDFFALTDDAARLAYVKQQGLQPFVAQYGQNQAAGVSGIYDPNKTTPAYNYDKWGNRTQIGNAPSTTSMQSGGGGGIFDALNQLFAKYGQQGKTGSASVGGIEGGVLNAQKKMITTQSQFANHPYYNMPQKATTDQLRINAGVPAAQPVFRKPQYPF